MEEPGRPAPIAPRIDPRPPTGNPEDVQQLLDGATSSTGGAQNIFLTMANHPGLLRRFLPFGGKLLNAGKLPPRDRELAILRTAWCCHCAYEWGQHARIGRQAGLTGEELHRIARGRPGAWGAPDALLLAAVDQLVGHHDLDQPTWDALAARYDDRQLLELTLLVGNYAMLAGMLNALAVQGEPGLEGLPGDAG